MAFLERQFDLSDGEQVVLRIFVPVEDRGDFRCDLEIQWPSRPLKRRHAFGIDGVQALLLALQTGHCELLLSPERKAGLTWLGERDLGMPLAEVLEDLRLQ